jgi:GT2 family glycosyltransferase
MTGRILIVSAGGRMPYASEVMAAADGSACGVVVFGSSMVSDVPEGRLIDLLTGPFGVGAVLPRSDWAGRDSAPASHDVDAATGPLVALKASLMAGAGIDPKQNDPDQVIRAALDSVRARGLRVVSEPTWVVGTCSDDQSYQPGERRGKSGYPSRVLVVTGDISGQRHGARSTRELIASLNAQIRHGELAIRLTERPSSADVVAAWRSQGISVEVGPPDPEARRGSDWGVYSHVIVTASGARSRARAWVEATQPQAARVMFFPSLAFREVEALSAITARDDLAGLELVRSSVEQLIGIQSRWADAVWCEDRLDADFISGLLPAKGIALIPPTIEATWMPVPLADRRGVVIAATQGYDVIAGTEEAAKRCLEEVLLSLRWSDPNLECSVVTDWPTPMLESAARRSGATLIGSDELTGAIASARVVLAAHQYGTGQRAVIVECLKAGTPFVATAPSLGGIYLGELASTAVGQTTLDLAARSLQLLSSDSCWQAAAGLARKVLADSYAADRRSSSLRGALAPLGIECGSPVERWPAIRVEFPSRRPRRPIFVKLRPEGSREPLAFHGTAPASEPERYQLWAERFGPNADVLKALRADLEGLKARPKFSILMPVYNTDRQLLVDAVDSIRTQIYDNWELCIANDGSDRLETREALDELRGDADIKVVDLDGQSGISAATNAALAVADGEFVAFLDHDDMLKPHALAQVARWIDADPQLDLIYSDEDKIDAEGKLRDPHLKPDWSPDQLLSQNYVCHLTVARRSLVEAVGALRSDYDGSQDYDLILRLSERTDHIGHIPEPLYSWRAVPGSFAADEGSKPYAIPAGRRAISAALQRRGFDGNVDTVSSTGRYRVHYSLPGNPRVAIIIPTRDRVDLLRRCIDSVVARSTYRNYEIVIVDNQSSEADTLAYLATGPWRVLRYAHPFHYARMINFAARLVECDALLFLNNDTEVIAGEWIEAMLEHAMRPEVGAVGARLFWPDGRPQHEGIIVGTWADWATNIDHRGYFHRGEIIRNTSAVTGACTMIRPSVYSQVGGADERLRVAWNDVDLCLRIRQAGYQVVYTPYAELYHHEGSSRRGYQPSEDGPLFGSRWILESLVDPYYSPVLSGDQPFEIKV